MTYLHDVRHAQQFIHTVNKVWRRDLRTCYQCHRQKVGNSNFLDSKIFKARIIFLLLFLKVAPLSTSPTSWIITSYHAFLMAVIYVACVNQTTWYFRLFILTYSLFGFKCLHTRGNKCQQLLWWSFPGCPSTKAIGGNCCKHFLGFSIGCL